MPLLVVAAFIVVPLVEIYVIIQVGHVLGALLTVALLLVCSILGAALVRREGARAWDGLRTGLRGGRLPAREVADGALVLFGGVLLLTPGFVTDAAGLLLVLPLTRPLFRRLLAGLVGRRLRVVPLPGARSFARPAGDRRPASGRDTDWIVAGQTLPPSGGSRGRSLAGRRRGRSRQGGANRAVAPGADPPD